MVVDHRHVRPPLCHCLRRLSMVDALAEHDGATLSRQPALHRAHVEPAKPRRLEDCIPIHCVTHRLGVGIRHEWDDVGAEHVGHAADRPSDSPRGPGMRCRGCARTVAASPLRPRRAVARRRCSARSRRWGAPAASGCPGSARRPSATSGKRSGVWSCRRRRGAPGSAARTSRCIRRAPCGGSRRRTPRAASRRGRTHPRRGIGIRIPGHTRGETAQWARQGIRAKRYIRCDCEDLRQSLSDPRGLLMYPDRTAERAPPAYRPETAARRGLSALPTRAALR